MRQDGLARLEATVRGRVQGVGFRYFVVRRALDLGVVGWVANEPDGSVQVVAEGSTAALDSLEAGLRVGPMGAVVEAVDAVRMAGNRAARSVPDPVRRAQRGLIDAAVPVRSGNRIGADRDFRRSFTRTSFPYPRRGSWVMVQRDGVPDLPSAPVPVESASVRPSRPRPSRPGRRVRPTLAEDLPEIYRAILDRVADLERIGARARGRSDPRASDPCVLGRLGRVGPSRALATARPRPARPGRHRAAARLVAPSQVGRRPLTRARRLARRLPSPLSGPPLSPSPRRASLGAVDPIATIGDAIAAARPAYDDLAALAEDVEDEWSYINDLADGVDRADGRGRRRPRPRAGGARRRGGGPERWSPRSPRSTIRTARSTGSRRSPRSCSSPLGERP